MTLDEAITRAWDDALKLCKNQETRTRGHESMQLAKWLEELKAYKAKYPDCRFDREYSL